MQPATFAPDVSEEHVWPEQTAFFCLHQRVKRRQHSAFHVETTKKVLESCVFSCGAFCATLSRRDSLIFFFLSIHFAKGDDSLV